MSRRGFSTFRNSLSHCVSVVKQHDLDAYLLGLLIPRGSKAAYFGIRAFNAEIAMIKDQARDNPMTGRIRFQWWADYFNEVYSNTKASTSHGGQPVTDVLSAAIPAHSLSQHWFERTLMARSYTG